MIISFRFAVLATFLLLLQISHSALASTEEVTFVTGYDGIKLTGRWMLPDAPVRGVAVIIAGSGNVDFDGDVSSPFIGHPHLADSAKLSLQLARVLSAKGVATLRYSKRGFENAAQLPNQITSIMAKDARTIALQARQRFPAVKFGLVGFSEGAIVSVLVSNEMAVDALFLIGLSTRPIDEIFRYQFSEWPLALMKNNLHPDRDGQIDLSEFKAQGLEKLIFADILPALNKPLADLDLDHNGKLSIETELKPAYEQGLIQVMGLMQTPGFAPWYNDLKAMQPVRELVTTMKSPVTYLYNAVGDAQMNTRWIGEDLLRFPGHTTTRRYDGVGHCFSPMEGSIGQVKTSGPMSDELLSGVAGDFETVLRP